MTEFKYGIIRPSGRGKRYIVTKTVMGDDSVQRILCETTNAADAMQIRSALMGQPSPVVDSEADLAARLPRGRSR